MTAQTPRYAVTYCSNCGGEFGPGDHGFSHCFEHRPPMPARTAFREASDRYNSACTAAYRVGAALRDNLADAIKDLGPVDAKSFGEALDEAIYRATSDAREALDVLKEAAWAEEHPEDSGP